MASEARRGCGYRRIGGTYLAADPGGFPCGMMPFELTPCPLCEYRPAFTRGLQRVTPKVLHHGQSGCLMGLREGLVPDPCLVCPFGKMMEQETAGLIWIGDRFYSPGAFQQEAATLGVSRRIPWPVPKWFTLGQTWVLCAHMAVLDKPCGPCGGTGQGWITEEQATGKVQKAEPCEHCEGAGRLDLPGVFFAFVPRRIERIVADTESEETLEKLREQGLTIVKVPHDDPDHMPTRRPRDDE